jgi:hypothetical protein
MRKLIVLAAVIVFLAARGLAQATAGSIEGAITDPSGAVVSSANITIANLDTGAVFRTTSNGSGNYVVTPLTVGRYSVAVEARGFTREVSTNIVVNVQDRLRLDFKLQVGAASTSVTVRDSAPLLQTDSSNLGQVVDTQNVESLPLNGRFVTNLAVLTAGVAPTPSGAPDAATGGFTANGVRPYENNYLLDGIDDNNMQAGMTSGTSYVIMPPPDAVGEFKLETNGMSAEFGRSAGGVMNVTTKSGTNQFHGALFEFIRNSALDANNYFNSGNPIPPFKQNQFGGTIGGPIIRDKTFFFGDYQGTRIREGLTELSTVPLPAWATGDFSSLADPAGSPTIFDPATTTVVNGVVTRQPFPNNQIPSDRFDPVAVKLFSMFPQPNVPGAGDANNFLYSPSLANDLDGFDTRIDDRVFGSDSLFFRFSFNNAKLVNPGALPPPLYDGSYQTGTNVTLVRTGVLGYTHIFDPRTINEFRTAYLYNNSALRAFNTDVNGASELGLPGIPFVPGNGGLPTFGVAGMSGFGGSMYSPTIEVQNEYLLMDTLTLVRGAHVLKVGMEARPRVDFSFLQPIGPRGIFSFSGQFTNNPNNPNNTGAGAADFLLGVETSAEITSFVKDYFQEPTYYAFVQDDYKATKSLTINAGLRYEFVSNPIEEMNREASFNLDTRSLDIIKGVTTPLPSNFDYADIPVDRNASRTLVPNNYLNFAPRLGFAWNLPNKSVLSGGFGTFFSSFEMGPLSDPNPGLNPPFYAQTSYSALSLTQPNPTVSQLSLGFPGTALTNPDTATFFSVESNMRNPYILDWNLAVQHELGWNTVFDIAYAASSGSKLYVFRDENQPLASSDPTAPLDPRRPMPYLGQPLAWWGSEGHSSFNALEAKLDKRFANGVTFLAAYTFGKAIDEASTASSYLGSDGSYRDSTRHPNWEKGLADYDVRHRFVFSYVYDLPFGQGKQFAGSVNRLTDAVIGGWEFVGIDAFQTGNPETIVANFNSANSQESNWGGQTRPDTVPGVSLKPAHQGPQDWYNLAALKPGALGTYGDIGRNTLEAPGNIEADFSLFKNIVLKEDRLLQFRAEFFNLPNHTNFNDTSIQVTYDEPGAGQISGALPAREIQFALKLLF